MADPERRDSPMDQARRFVDFGMKEAEASFDLGRLPTDEEKKEAEKLIAELQGRA